MYCTLRDAFQMAISTCNRSYPATNEAGFIPRGPAIRPMWGRDCVARVGEALSQQHNFQGEVSTKPCHVFQRDSPGYCKPLSLPSLLHQITNCRPSRHSLHLQRDLFSQHTYVNNAIRLCAVRAAGTLTKCSCVACLVRSPRGSCKQLLPAQAQASSHSLDRRTSKLDCGVPTKPRAIRAKRSYRAVADSRAAVGAAAVAEAPRVDLVPKPVTSVLHDLTRFHGLPSLGTAHFCLPEFASCFNTLNFGCLSGTTSDYHEAERCFTSLLGAEDLDVQLRYPSIAK